MSSENDYGIQISGEWPIHYPETVFFALTVSLDGRANGSPSCEPIRPADQVLRHIARLLLKFAAEAFRLGYQVRVDVASAVAKDGTWPRWCSTLEQFSSLMVSILGSSNNHHSQIYPASVWLLPDGAPDIDAQIDIFRVERFDEELYRSILSSGVVRIMLDEPFCDIVADRYMGEQVLTWMQSAVKATTETAVRWRLIAE